MSGPFPCSNPPSTCETSPNPATSFSSEAADSTTFIALAWNNNPPALGAPFTSTPCEAIAESQVSQADADRIAANQALNCSNPCATPVFNSAQVATALCSDGNPYSFTVPAGIYSGENQVLADRKAFAAATAGLRGHSICLGSVAPASVCRGEFYFGIISIVTTDTPVTTELVQGELPEGLAFSFESTRVVIQGTPAAFGNSQFALRCTSAAGVVTSRLYSITVTGIVTSSLSDGTEGDVYSAQLTTVVPDGVIASWAVTQGTLPDGLTLDAATGIISGTPTTPETSSFTVSVTVAGSTCSTELSIHVQSSGPPPPECITPYATLDIPGNLSGEASGTRDPATRRVVVSAPNDDAIIFVNTATNAIITTAAVPGLGALGTFSKGSFAAFATSSKQFYVTLSTGVAVLDADGNYITTIALPMNGNKAAMYSPTQDRVYVPSFDGTTRHIIIVNPNTNTVVGDVDLGFNDNCYFYYAPGLDQILCNHPAFKLETYSLPAVTLANTLLFQNNTDMVFASGSSQWFVPNWEFGSPFHITVIDGATLTVVTSIEIPSFTSTTYGIQYNPVKNTVIAFSGDGQIAVINVADLSIICELQDDDFFAGAVCVDCSSGDDYLLDYNGVGNPLLIYH